MTVVAARYPWRRLVYPLVSGPPTRNPTGWVTTEPSGSTGARPLASYQDLAVIALLAERGAGKSDILAAETRRLQESGVACNLLDLPDLEPGDPTELDAVLAPPPGDAPWYVLLDSLDEAMDGDPGISRVLGRRLRDMPVDDRSRLRLRIACRSSRWPSRLGQTLEELWPPQLQQLAYLGVAGLTRADVVLAAELNGLDESFAVDLEQRRLVVPLASWPVTLRPLLAAAARGEPLPANTAQAFALACERLCTETNPARRDDIGPDHPSPLHLLSAARRTAAVLQFGTRDVLADVTDENRAVTVPQLARGTEPDLYGHQVPCTEHLLRKLTESAIMAPLSPRRWGFAHRSFQEYLAARFLEIHHFPAQVRRAMLIAGDGSARHVVSSQQQVAAWLALTDDGLFEDILACDPQVLLLADLTARDPSDRYRLTESLLQLVHDDYTVQLDPLGLYRLDHPGLADQLAAPLDPGQPSTELYAALLIARACPQPALTSSLLALAEDPAVSERLRCLAVEAISPDAVASIAQRLLAVSATAPPDLTAAVLRILWPKFLSTSEMLSRLPEPPPATLAEGWSFLHGLPGLLQAADLSDVLSWASNTLSGSQGPEHKRLAVRLLAWATPLAASDISGRGSDIDGYAAQLAEIILTITRSPEFDDPSFPLNELSTELAECPELRRMIARHVLDRADDSDIGGLTVGSALCVFPNADAAYWAAQLPSLRPDLPGRLRHPLSNPPADHGEWATVAELAEGNDLIREHTSHWYILPIDHPLGRQARQRREHEKRAAAQRDANRYNSADLTAGLDKLMADEMPVRDAWLAVIVGLHRTLDGDPIRIGDQLDLCQAPGFGALDSGQLGKLQLAAAHVIRTAPLVTEADVSPAGARMADVPEIWALSILAQYGGLAPGDLDAERWAGLAYLLTCADETSPDDQALRTMLLAMCVNRAGQYLEAMIPSLLDALSLPRLHTALSRLTPTLTPGLSAQLLSWAQAPQRSLQAWSAVMEALVRHADQDAIDNLRNFVQAVQDPHIKPEGESGQRWISAASILARCDTAASWKVIVSALNTNPVLAKPLLVQLADHSGPGDWPMDMSALAPSEIAELYDLLVIHGPAASTAVPGPSGFMPFGTDQKLVRLHGLLPQILADRLTIEAGDQLRALCDRYPGDWQLRHLARVSCRELAERTWQPTELEDLLKLSGDSALRLVHDEHQLREVTEESITRLQRLLSQPNGWAVLLWNRQEANASTGWWPAWEEDLSDLVATYLQHDLAEHRVIVNREVQIQRPGLSGRRTDIHVQAQLIDSPPEPQPLTVIIECKGCWNSEMPSALSLQLVDKYLSRPGRHAGIYLVGYFDNPHWNHQTRPGREHSSHDIDQIRADQTAIAREQAAQKAVSVTAVVLDCRLPADPDPSAQQTTISASGTT